MNTPCVVFSEELAISLNLDHLADFREWITSEDALTKGRINFINGCIEVSIEPEDLFTHNLLKSRLLAELCRVVDKQRLGCLFMNPRFSSPLANLSAAPDLLFASRASFQVGLIRFVPAQSDPERSYELEGAPDIAAEVADDNSVEKDTKRLPAAYFVAEIPEYWLFDARGGNLQFDILHRGESCYQKTPCDAEGYQFSAVLNHRFKLMRQRDETGIWDYDLLAETV